MIDKIRLARNDRLLSNQDFCEWLKFVAKKSGFMFPLGKTASEFDAGYRQAMLNMVSDIVVNSTQGADFIADIIRMHQQSAGDRATMDMKWRD